MFHKNIEHVVQERLKGESTESKGKKLIFDPEISLEELKRHINKLKLNKSPVPDGIPSEIIKSSTDELILVILKIMNKIKSLSIYPAIWSTGLTSLIFKDGDEENPNNYRAINVGNTLSKVFISIINERVNKMVLGNKLIGDYQIGFKKEARPADHIFVLKSAIDKYLGNGKKMYACFVDYQKAFDNIWREGLYYKMITAGISTSIIKLIRDMYNKNNQCLKLNGWVTGQFPSIKGVKQGCVLSPILFNIFLNDLPTYFNKACKPIIINNEHINCLMYADDVLLLSESKEGLSECLNQLYAYNKKWCLTINKRKTKVITFQVSGKTKKLNIKYNNTLLEETNEYKYLGTIKTGNFKQNNIFLKKKGMRASFSLINGLGTNIKLSSL